MIKNFDEMLSVVKNNKTMRLAVAAAQDKDVIEAVASAAKLNLVEPILVGDEAAIKDILKDIDAPYDFKIVNEPDTVQSAKTAVSLVRVGEADFLMKGLLQTADIMRAVLDKETGLRTDSLISHVMVYQAPSYDKLLF